MSSEVMQIEIPLEVYEEDPESWVEMSGGETLVVVTDKDNKPWVYLYETGTLLEPRMSRFVLFRRSDLTGISGIGVVAEGVRFSDGTVALRWRGEYATTVVHSSIDSVVHIHGHHGATSLEWVD